METMYLVGLIVVALICMFYYNKRNNELSWTVGSVENNASCKKVCKNNVCNIECDK